MDNQTFALVIYELVPEETRLYLIPDPPSWLLGLHGKIRNTLGFDDADPALMTGWTRLSDATAEDPSLRMHPDDPLAGAWVKHRLATEGEPPVVSGPVAVVWTGEAL